MARLSDQLPEKDLKQAPQPPFPFEKKRGEVNIASSKNYEETTEVSEEDNSLKEALKLIDKFEQKGREFKQQLDKLYEKKGVTPEYLHDFMTNPDNFTPSELANFKKQRQEFVNRLSIPPDLIHCTKELMGESRESKSFPTDSPSKLKRASRRSWWLKVR